MIRHQPISLPSRGDQIVVACVLIGAVLGSSAGVAAFGSAIPGTIPGALIGYVIGKQLTHHAARTN